MPYQNINVTISPADLQAIKDSFAAILGKLPFLVNLTANERKAILKTGPGSLSFVQNASSAAQNNVTIFHAPNQDCFSMAGGKCSLPDELDRW